MPDMDIIAENIRTQASVLGLIAKDISARSTNSIKWTARIPGLGSVDFFINRSSFQDPSDKPKGWGLRSGLFRIATLLAVVEIIAKNDEYSNKLVRLIR